MARKQGSGFHAPSSCSLSPIPLDVEWGVWCSRSAMSRGLTASACMPGLKATSVGHCGWTALRQRAPLGDLLPCLDTHNIFSLPLQKNNLINHPKMPHTLTRKNHYLHIFLHACSIISTLQMWQTCLRIRILYFFQMAENQLSTAAP